MPKQHKNYRLPAETLTQIDELSVIWQGLRPASSADVIAECVKRIHAEHINRAPWARGRKPEIAASRRRRSPSLTTDR
jgi:hypothetical protein